MNKVLIGLVAVLLLGSTAGYYLWQNPQLIKQLPMPAKVLSTTTAWKYQKNITQPITASVSQTQATTLGDLSKDKVTVEIAKGAFDRDTMVTLSNPDSVPELQGNKLETIGAPIELSIGKPTRLNDKAEITFQFDTTQLSPNTQPYQLKVVYHNGTQWDYIRPTKVDLAAGTMTFETYHFSLFGANKVGDDTKITEQWIHSQAADNKLREGLNDLSDEITNKIIDLTLQKMGISDESIKGKILGDVLKNDAYRNLHDAYKAGDVSKFNQEINLLIGSKIAENVPESIFSKALGALAENAEDVEAVSKAAGYAAEGQYKEAARIIGEQIADKFLITTAGKIATEVINYQIQSWKNAEVEAAFTAYKNGANGVFYGYNVDKGDFDGVWSQMRGIGRQLEIEAIDKENEIREEAGLPPLTDKQMDSIRNSVKASFQKQFEARVEQEDAIAAEEAKLKAIMEAFKKADFFGIMTPSGLDKGYDLEQKLDILHHFAQKMMRDTGRKDITDKTGLLVDGKLSLDDLVQGARIYFSGPDGLKAYQQFLADRFGLDIFPKLVELTGTWTGTMTITDVIVPEKITDETKAEIKKQEGCENLNFDEIGLDLKKMIGKEQPLSLTISPSSETGGTMTVGKEGDGKEMAFTYEGGVIKATYTEKGGTATLSLTPSKQDKTYAIGGSMIMNYKELFKITASVAVKK